MEITFPWPHKDLSPNARVHWAVKSKRARAQKMDAFARTYEAKAKVDWEGDIHLFIDFFQPDRRERDQDNMLSSCKSMLDGMAEALGVNDKRFRLHPYVRDGIGGMVKIKIARSVE